MKYKKRAIEEILRQYLKQFKVVLVTGPRQVGKSTLLKQILQDKYEYVTLDDMNELDMAQSDPAQFFRNHRTPLIIDEVQYAPNLFRQIKYLADQSDEKGQFCLTGSQTYELMQNVSESLAGRIGILELSGFSLREQNGIECNIPFLPTEQYYEIRKSSLIQENDIWSWIFRGSMPELLDAEINQSFFYNSYIKTYIERDVRQLINVKDEKLFYQFLIAAAARTGELFVPNDIANTIGVSLQTVKAWTSVLEASGLIFILRPYSNNILKRAIKTSKIYFADTGLVCSLVGWDNPTTLRNGAMSGNIFETYIISEIIKSYRNAGHDTNSLYYYRDRDKKEIDMLIIKNATIHPIEIKKSAQPASSMAKNFPVLKEIPNMTIGEGCIICLAEKLMRINDTLSIVPISYL